MQRKSRDIRACTSAAKYAAVPTAQRPRASMPIRRTAAIGVGFTWHHLHAYLQHIPASTRRNIFYSGSPDESRHIRPERWEHSPVQATGTSPVPGLSNSRCPEAQTTSSPLGAESQTASTRQRKQRRLFPAAQAAADPTVAITASEGDWGPQSKRHQPKKTWKAGSRPGLGTRTNAGDSAATSAASGVTAATIAAGAGAEATRAAGTVRPAKGQMRSPAPRECVTAQAGQHIPHPAVPHTALPTRPHSPADGMRSPSTRGHEGRNKHQDPVLSAAPVYVFWDLDNKYPETLGLRGLIDNMRKMLHQYGEVVEIRAYANYHTLNFVPDIWQEAMLRGVEVSECFTTKRVYFCRCLCVCVKR
ncbi:hypothetical protein Vafri_20954 [Volvox africanus]|uniref:NYN domain-containing protein n=1 Tax=Volvox africanus TaxID=51714 RepID=A0A8J4FDL6_9CHLO|nr:hypothetical protein Vafri_20954 [Volvox africanus]